MHFMNGLNQTILRKPIPVYHKMFSPHTERLDTADQSWWWKFKSPCTMTTCPADQSQRLQNTYLKFWEVLPLMLPTPAQKRLKKGNILKNFNNFSTKKNFYFYVIYYYCNSSCRIPKTLDQLYSNSHKASPFTYHYHRKIVAPV